MASVKKHLPALQLIQTSKPKLRKNIILHCDLDLIRTIDECIYNTLNGNIILHPSEIENLKKFKSILRKILKTKGGLSKKREIISQNGGAFLATLLKPIVTAGLVHFVEKERK